MIPQPVGTLAASRSLVTPEVQCIQQQKQNIQHIPITAICSVRPIKILLSQSGTVFMVQLSASRNGSYARLLFKKMAASKMFASKCPCIPPTVPEQ